MEIVDGAVLGSESQRSLCLQTGAPPQKRYGML
jgi:hypothetical protein